MDRNRLRRLVCAAVLVALSGCNALSRDAQVTQEQWEPPATAEKSK